MRALPSVWSQDAETTEEGLRIAEQAIDLDPTYGIATAPSAWTYPQRATYMRTPKPTAERAKTVSLAQEPASITSHDPLVLTVLSAAYMQSRLFHLGLTTIEKALA